MAVSPINLSRISNNMQHLSLLNSLRQNNLRLFLEQSRVACGLRLNAPSENPVLAARVLQLSELLDRQNQMLANIRHADSILSATDTAIGEINSLLIDAHNIALSMVSTTTSSEERRAEAQLILGIIDQLVTVGNRRYGDIYLFGGQQTQRAPFTQDYGVAEYRGDEGPLRSNVDYGQDPRINLNGAELFGALTGVVRGWVDLNPAITDQTRLADMQGAGTRGIGRGFIRITLTDPGTSFLVDLTAVDTAGDVIDAINHAARQAGLNVGAGGDFLAEFNAARNGLQLSVAAGTISVTEVGDGRMAADLGILADRLPRVVGEDLRPRVTPMTTIASLFGGAGADLGTFGIDNGHLSAEIDLAGAVTVQDILNRINAAPVAVEARINSAGTGIDVVNRASGLQMRIRETGGSTATRLGIRSFHAGSRLAEMNRGRGVTLNTAGNDLQITAKNGAVFQVALRGSQTVQDVLDRINAAAAAAGVDVQASLAVSGNGIRILDRTGGAGPLRIDRADYSYAGDGLGLLKSTAGDEIISEDTAGVVADSVFTALHELYTGLMQDDERAIGEAARRLETFMNTAARLQGEVGSRSRAMSARLSFTEAAVTGTQALLSEARDLDYSEAITRFQQAQMTLQANLLTGSRFQQLSLLNYLS